jgi:lysophospholipase L1-like esterase
MPVTAVVAIALAALVCAVSPAAGAGPLIALGDSYSSGEGVPPFVDGTATRFDTCHRSPFAWPLLVARDESRPALSYACSGALTGDVVDGRDEGEPERRVAQIRGLAGQAPAIVTLTIGGNDVGFKSVLTRCFAPGDCRRFFTAGGTDVLESRIEALEGRLPAFYRRVAAAAPGAQLVVAGYPRIFATRRALLTCGGIVNALSPAEARYLNDKSASLNAAIQRAAALARVRFVDVTDALAGHEISCRTHVWVHRLNAHLSYSFHPTRPGHRAIAQVVEAALDAFPAIPRLAAPW